MIELGSEQIDLLDLVADHLDVLSEFDGVLDRALRDGYRIFDDELSVRFVRGETDDGQPGNEDDSFHGFDVILSSG
ncbi:MAG: hypothetical protein LRY55_03740 [Leadbetterella sp.]|nr:hypothetical protein [Leadbetterella sp.]